MYTNILTRNKDNTDLIFDKEVIKPNMHFFAKKDGIIKEYSVKNVMDNVLEVCNFDDIAINKIDKKEIMDGSFEFLNLGRVPSNKERYRINFYENYSTNVVKTIIFRDKIMAIAKNCRGGRYLSELEYNNVNPSQLEINLVCFQALFNKELSRAQHIWKDIRELENELCILEEKLNGLPKYIKTGMLVKNINSIKRHIKRKTLEVNNGTREILQNKIKELKNQLNIN